MKQRLIEQIEKALEALKADGFLSEEIAVPPLQISIPKERKFGDYATNVAMILGKKAGMNPRDFATRLIETMGEGGGLITKAEVAGPGFVNFFVKQENMFEVLGKIEAQGDAFGQSDAGQGRKTLIEFVSANPTGPLHVGHGRGAVFGDTLGRIMKAAGFDVSCEYYVNDAGLQIQTLGKSTLLRYRELLGEKIEIPEGHYVGDYLIDVAKQLREKHGDGLNDDDVPMIALFAADKILNSIRNDCEVAHVSFDSWFSEKTLHDSGKIEEKLQNLKERGIAFEKDGALWFGTEKYGDDKDRVLVKSDGQKTYFAADVAYHADKFDRGFDLLINVWGADHHGYIARMKAAVEAMGRRRDDLDVLLIQLVSLLRGGQVQQMSTRSGSFVTLATLVKEVGADALRYFYLMRRHDAQLEFDIDLALEQSNKNPVFYVQYMHARICSIIEKAEKEDVPDPKFETTDCALLDLAEEKELARHLAEFPRVVSGAAMAREPHRLIGYVHDLAGKFHSYYHHNRVISDDAAKTGARLLLCKSARQVVKNALALSGISAPQSM